MIKVLAGVVYCIAVGVCVSLTLSLYDEGRTGMAVFCGLMGVLVVFYAGWHVVTGKPPHDDGATIIR